jgi:hypothetical protein
LPEIKNQGIGFYLADFPGIGFYQTFQNILFKILLGFRSQYQIINAFAGQADFRHEC